MYVVRIRFPILLSSIVVAAVAVVGFIYFLLCDCALGCVFSLHFLHAKPVRMRLNVCVAKFVLFIPDLYAHKMYPRSVCTLYGCTRA